MAYAASSVMQPLIGQSSTHLGLSKSPSHSVQVSGSILVMPFLVLIESVGHSGSQSPQEVQRSASIFIAMMILLFQVKRLAFHISYLTDHSAASRRLARNEMGSFSGAAWGSMK
jgi:hypothetical protein